MSSDGIDNSASDFGASTDVAQSVPVKFAANEIRLDLREWLVTAAIVIGVLTAIPPVWSRCEEFHAGDDYRVPVKLSSDVWVYARLVHQVNEENGILVIGDSVIWGEYVRPDQTLVHELNRQVPDRRFVNGGLSGGHPLALEGLVRDAAGEIQNAKVVLHLNLLWLSSPQRDLSDDSGKEISFNHPQLIPQFRPRIPAYQATVSDRLSVVADRSLPVRGWVQHLRTAWFGGLDIPTWTTEHPYENPFSAVSWQLPQPRNSSPQGDKPVAWNTRGIQPVEFDWVPLDDSLQWQAFLRTVARLKHRGNRIFVVVGPLNLHMLTKKNAVRFRRLKAKALQRLQADGIAHFAPPLLPSDKYADASHPLAAGYSRLAEQISDSPAFREWIGQ
ncbi:MAG: hypothetical protein IID45_08705 [Planctomycetes bacterium]|nr:hypothetical protein [Planctomycetota bacterium]